ncbi:hypothetical protein CN689_24420 [Peribacillus butanolivorans]|uniref:GNAT family N-acetyltransferase n=1 Tax=Peribacillus butanolivorans TaxID=421767 RepID=A0AAX0RWL3_9BACI|nr:hypothetical protein CN689_24420 [Peribacillus butanolivorans]
MLIHKIDDEVSLRLFNVGDAEEFFNLIISSEPYLKEWLGRLDYVEKVEDTVETRKSRLQSFFNFI